MPLDRQAIWTYYPAQRQANYGTVPTDSYAHTCDVFACLVYGLRDPKTPAYIADDLAATAKANEGFRIDVYYYGKRRPSRRRTFFHRGSPWYAPQKIKTGETAPG